MKVNLGFDQEQLAGLINAIKEQPELGKTVWKAETRWKEGFQSEAIIRRESGQHTVPMDEPKQVGGSDTAPNMVEMVLGAYGCCLTTGYVAQAGLRGIPLEGVDIEVEGDLDLRGFLGLDPNVPAGYSEVRAKVNLRAPGVSPEQLKELHDAVVATSPVGNIISAPIKLKTDLV
jgi:uncharacterized OsmC-like protein